MEKGDIGGMTTFLLPENLDPSFKTEELTSNKSMNPDNEPLESNANGVTPGIKPPDSSLKSKARQKKAPELLMIERRNWLIHLYYVRKSFDECKVVIREQLEETRGMCEYANYVQGLIHRQEGRIQDSFELFQLCNILNPNSVENLKQMARSLSLLGRHKLATEAYVQAERKCEKPDWEIHHNLGVCYLYMKDVKKAKEQLSLALDQNKHPLSFNILAKICQSEGDVNGAIATYKSAVDFSPENADLHTSLGLLYMQAGNFQHAFEHLGTALTFDPKHSKAILAAGSMMQNHQDYDVALSKYRIAAQNLPESAPLWNNIAMCFFGKKKYVAAISCLKRANYISPFDWKILYNLGLVHLTMQQYASSFHFLSAAVNLKSTKGSIFMLLAVTLTHLDDEENAQSAYEQAMQLDSKDPTICLNYSIFLMNHERKTEAVRIYNDFQSRMNSYRQAGNELEAEVLDAATKLASKLGIESAVLTKKSSKTHLDANIESSFDDHPRSKSSQERTTKTPENVNSVPVSLPVDPIPKNLPEMTTNTEIPNETSLSEHIYEEIPSENSKPKDTVETPQGNELVPEGEKPVPLNEAAISDDDDEEDLV